MVATSTVGWLLNIKTRYSLGAAVLIALALAQILSRGMTTSLREMAGAADRMADGDLTPRVTVTTADEVGQLGESFNAMADHIAGLEQQRRDLIANVSHELRTPLAVLQGNIENLLDGVAANDTETLEAMQRQTRRLTGLVEALLDLSRLEAGAAPMQRQACELVGLVEGVVDEVTQVDGPARIEVQSSGPVSLEADPERLHQVVTNLLDNAIRHSPADEAVQVNVSVEAGQGWARLEIRDHGPGIPAGDLTRIFERYQRAGPEAADTAGTGLGLAIAKELVELHGGSIEASDASGGGCLITVQLPLHPIR